MSFNINTLKEITILYVEDENLIREQTADIFKSVFKHAYIAKDGNCAIYKFTKHQDDIDIVISDITMPIMDGIELAQEIYKLNPNIPIIFTTAYNSKEYQDKAKELGISKFITKPIKIKDLMLQISSIANLTKIAKED
jgi:CheY-like chemotaxis protein